MSIRHWPEGERPREKLLSRGSHALSDAELLAVLLGSGTRGMDAIALGRELLTRAGSLNALLGCADQQIGLPGLGPAKRARITAALELARRSLAEQLAERPTLALCICLVDSNIPPQASDIQLTEFLRTIERPYMVVATKADRLTGNGRTKAKQTLSRALSADNLLLCSAKTGLGMKELWSEIHRIAAEHGAKIK